ncbi:MAG TPA: hypothetical protein VMW23_00260 [Sedimentisphaerales bacterium]|nr:hypothetical protein [Sedimentisphaerales bacterium]
MELSWPMKLRIAAAAGLGVVLIGVLCAPLGDWDQRDTGILLTRVGLGGGAVLGLAAFFAGAAAYFICWPYGRQIAVLAVPSGLSLWAVRSGTVADVLQTSPLLSQRLWFFGMLKYESLLWLAIVGLGFAGVLAAEMLCSKTVKTPKPVHRAEIKFNTVLRAAAAAVVSIGVVWFSLGVLCQDVRLWDNYLGSVVGQPAVAQIVYAVVISFGLAGFVIKKLLDAAYGWVLIAAVFVTYFGSSTYIRNDILGYTMEHIPPVFFPQAAASILPIQLVVFGTLGAIIGYWTAVRYTYWRQHESE